MAKTGLCLRDNAFNMVSEYEPKILGWIPRRLHDGMAGGAESISNPQEFWCSELSQQLYSHLSDAENINLHQHCLHSDLQAMLMETFYGNFKF